MNMKTFICAEFAQGFEGDVKLCRSLIKAASRSGADAVKFQIFKAFELCTEDYPYFDFFKSLEIPKERWDELILYAKDLGMEFHTDVFGVETLNWAISAGVDGLKVHSSDIKNYSFLSLVKNFKGKIFLSVGGSHLNEIERALSIIDNNDIVLISGFQAEPNQLSDIELDKIMFLKKRFGLEISYADHIDAKDTLALSLPAMAVLKGATFIEKHLTLERDFLELEDSVSALNPREFREMVKLIREVELFHSSGDHYLLGERELKYRKNTKKIAIASRDLCANTVVNEDDVCFLRTGEKVEELIDIDEIVGKKLKTNLGKFKAFRGDYLN